MSDAVQEIRGKLAVIEFEGVRCIHSRNCVLDRPDVFVPNTPGDWIKPDSATPEEIAAIAHNCPSGAIRYQRLDGGPGEQAPLVNVIRVRENGPLAVHADVDLAGHGALYRAVLCRCGESRNKPFCDARHVAAAFQATGEPASRESTPLADRAGKLTITPARNGPLLLSGNVEICSGTGRTVDRTMKAALCRCGQSGTKPYCDGTHAKVGFTAD